MALPAMLLEGTCLPQRATEKSTPGGLMRQKGREKSRLPAMLLSQHCSSLYRDWSPPSNCSLALVLPLCIRVCIHDDIYSMVERS